MYKCIFCKKHSIKGLYCCEITGQIFVKRCKGYTPTQIKHILDSKNKCPNFTASIFDRFIAWIDLR